MAAAAKITKAFINVTEAPLMGLITTVNISMNPFDKRSVRAKFVIWNFIFVIVGVCMRTLRVERLRSKIQSLRLFPRCMIRMRRRF